MLRALALLAALLPPLLGPAFPLGAQERALPDSIRSRVDQVFSFIQDGDPGCALGVIQEGRLAYGQGYGLANLDWQIPMGTTTTFDIGSVSKQFTATAVALLELDGVLSLDDDVRRWIPELPDYGSTITLRHLLNHTSGIRDYLTLMSLAGLDFANVFDEEDGVRLIARQRALNFEPGEEFLYSNSGYLLLAAVVRRAAGLSLRELLQERVFQPLGMARSSVWDSNTEIVAQRATGYSRSPSGGWRINHAWNFQMGGDGQVITAIEDLARWDGNFYNPVVGGQALLDRLHTRGILNSGDTTAYALGLTLDRYRGLPRVQHGGSWAGFRAVLARFPQQRTSIAIECNRSDANPGAYASAVADLVLAAAFPEAPSAPAGARPGAAGAAAAPTEPEATPPPAPSEEELARWAGAYRHPQRPEYRFFAVRDGHLWLEAGAGMRLTPLSPTTFQAPGGGATFAFSASEEGVRVEVGGSAFHQVGGAPPTPAELAGLAGSYRSDELDAVFRIGVEGQGLTLERPRNEPVPLRPGGADEFVAPGATLTFVRERGRVTGFRVYAGRVTGIVFEREG